MVRRFPPPIRLHLGPHAQGPVPGHLHHPRLQFQPCLIQPLTPRPLSTFIPAGCSHKDCEACVASNHREVRRAPLPAQHHPARKRRRSLDQAVTEAGERRRATRGSFPGAGATLFSRRLDARGGRPLAGGRAALLAARIRPAHIRPPRRLAILPFFCSVLQTHARAVCSLSASLPGTMRG